jgi:hypothetical protein
MFSSPNERFMVQLLAACLVFAALLYGTSYQQFRWFSYEYTVALKLGDTESYREMLHGNYEVDTIHKYRFAIPSAASVVHRVLQNTITDHETLDKVSFYVLNFTICWLAVVLFYLSLLKMGFSYSLSLLGGCMFLANRIMVITAGTPLVDSIYFLAISAIVCLSLYERVRTLALLLPFLALTKESILPFLFLPLFFQPMRHKSIIVSIVVSVILLKLGRDSIDMLSAAGPEAGGTLLLLVAEHLPNVPENFLKSFTPVGIYMLLNGFTLFFPLAVYGALVQFRDKAYTIPWPLFLCLPVAYGLALLSGSLGRMFFASFGIVIPLALVGLQGLMSSVTGGSSMYKEP